MKTRNYVISLFVGITLLFITGCSKDDPVSPDDGGGNGGGSSWKVLGDLNVNHAVYTLTSDQNGNIYAAGDFRNSAGYRYVAKWNGSSWTDIGLNANNIIRKIISDKNGNLYAIGDFNDANSKYYIAKFNGSTWSKIYDNSYLYSENNEFTAICVDAQGTLYASNGSLDGYHYYVTKWNGTKLSVLGSINANWQVSALVTDASGTLYAGGSFTNGTNYYVAKFNGSWSDAGLHVDSEIDGLCADKLGNVYAKGGFENTSGNFYISRMSNGSWSDIGLNANDYIYNICVDQNNNLYANGGFTDAPSNHDGNKYVAKWNGSKWTSLGSMTGLGTGGALCVDLNGYVYASGFNSANGVYVAVYK